MNFEDFIVEGNKSGDSSLHDWFNKSKSSDGTKGWVQLGGKYAGKPCARQEGQTTKPKCGSSKMKRNLNKKEEDAAFRRKNREDGNPDKKGKAKNVATEGVSYEHFTEGLVSGALNVAKNFAKGQAVSKAIDTGDKVTKGKSGWMNKASKVADAATSLNPVGITLKTLNAGPAAAGTLDDAKAKGLYR